MANIITGSRVLFSLILLFTKTFSTSFYTLHILAGISDVLDGIVARKFKLQSKFGEKLDTVADICFVGATLYKLLSVVKLPIWLWLWICVVVLLKLANIISGFWRKTTFIAMHTFANRVTGILFFLFPFTLPILPVECGAGVVCVIATIAAMHERKELMK